MALVALEGISVHDGPTHETPRGQDGCGTSGQSAGLDGPRDQLGSPQGLGCLAGNTSDGDKGQSHLGHALDHTTEDGLGLGPLRAGFTGPHGVVSKVNSDLFQAGVSQVPEGLAKADHPTGDTAGHVFDPLHQQRIIILHIGPTEGLGVIGDVHAEHLHVR